MVDLQEIIGDHETFLDDLLNRVVGEGFDLADFSQIDHMCYRTISTENYIQKQQELTGVAKL